MGDDGMRDETMQEESLVQTLEEMCKKDTEGKKQARTLGLLLKWILEDRFRNPTALVAYAQDRKLPMNVVAPWLSAKINAGWTAQTVIVTDMNGKKFEITVKEVY